MTVTFVRSGLMMPGKFPEGQQFVRDRSEWLEKNFDVKSTVMALLGGQIGRIAIASENESVAQIEEIRRAIVGGALPKELATGQAGLFVPGETRDRIWLHVS
jgi:hypothetical protein